jgi:hypothetical protein
VLDIRRENVNNSDHKHIENEIVSDETGNSADQLSVMGCSYENEGKKDQLRRDFNIPNLKCIS